MNEERINQIIDDLALGRYDSNEKGKRSTEPLYPASLVSL
jgi:hypothetical protein